MAERAAAAGGVLKAGRTQEGFVVHANLPYQPAR
jgi:signal transduction histidine kinase